MILAAPGVDQGSCGTMKAKHAGTTCADCYFRQAGLCALPDDVPCPTFRVGARGALRPPRQPRLVARGLGAFAENAA